jgi:hypothetical protein
VPAPYTHHFSPYTLHPTPCTLHPTPFFARARAHTHTHTHTCACRGADKSAGGVLLHTRACLLLLQNVFSYYRMCSLTIECVLLQGHWCAGWQSARCSRTRPSPSKYLRAKRHRAPARPRRQGRTRASLKTPLSPRPRLLRPWRVMLRALGMHMVQAPRGGRVQVVAADGAAGGW